MMLQFYDAHTSFGRIVCIVLAHDELDMIHNVTFAGYLTSGAGAVEKRVSGSTGIIPRS
jgi:hypothetical protein